MPLSKPLEIPTFQVGQAIAFCNTLFAEFELRIEGEVANFSLNRGKFIFFDLKDEHEEARLSCFMMAYQLSTPLEDGMRVVVQGKAGLYQKSGQFRISVQRVEAVGEGSLKRAFELLKLKLEREGLFALDRKRRLPRFAQKVGVISSKDAAGLGDFKRIALGRLPGVQFTVVHVAVQGAEAEREICAAFEYLNGYLELDAIALVRGGGSVEDLHAFNSEPVARAIVRSKFPVIVGVGHEKDITIADYCADVRAATPSNAAQLLLPSREEVVQSVQALTEAGRLSVQRSLIRLRERVMNQTSRTAQTIRLSIVNYRQRAQSLARSVEDLSPKQTLLRGYSITYDSTGSPTSAKTTKAGSILRTIVADGTIHSTVIQPND